MNWNAGLAYTWRRFTLDLHYPDTGLRDCGIPVTANRHNVRSVRCSFIAKLSVDLTKKNLK